MFLLCDNYSGFCFARRLKTKTGREVSIKLNQVLSAIKQIYKGKPVVLSNDLGKEFHNARVHEVLRKYSVKMIKPVKTKIAPFIEQKVRVFKRYIRLVSHLIFKSQPWYLDHILNSALKSMNNIQRLDGYSPLEIVTHFKRGNNQK